MRARRFLSTPTLVAILVGGILLGTTTLSVARPLAVPTGPVWSGLTIVGSTGQEIADVTVQWLTGGARLRVIRPGSAFRDFHPSEVRALRFADGRDATVDIAAARPGGASIRDTRPLGSDRDPRIFSHTVDFGFGYSMIMGDWFAEMEYGMLGQAGIRVGLGEHLYTRVLYRHQFGNIDSFLRETDPNTGELELSGPSGSVDEFMLLMGSSITSIDHGGPFAVIEIGAGVVNRHLRNHAWDLRAETVDSTVTEFALHIGLASIIPLDEASVIEVGFSLVIKPSFMGDEDRGGATISAHVGYSFVSW